MFTSNYLDSVTICSMDSSGVPWTENLRSSLDQLRDDIDTLDDFRKGLDQRLDTNSGFA